ncbi:MAG: primosomal protein N' [Desulfobacteraceae bacterium]|nr:primosomal protein N' [Desulfobacteraceae bacterium]
MDLYIEAYLCLPVNDSFFYSVPSRLEPEVETGKRIIAPFGHRKVTGYIKKILKTKPEINSEIKDIFEVPDKISFFSEKLLHLFEWISNYYIYPPGLVIKSALPSGINPDISKIVKITSQGLELLNDPENYNEFKVLNILKDNEKSEKELLGSGSDKKTLLNLKNKNLIEFDFVVPKPKTKEKLEKFLIRQKSETALNLTDRQLEVLEQVPFDKEILKKTITSKIKGSASVISALVKKGLLKETEQRVLRDPLGEAVEKDIPPVLNEEQRSACEKINPFIGKDFKRYLLYGITGSGKTEVYLSLVKQALELGKTALVLVPEISLISQTERRFKARFGDNTAVIHSNLSPGEKLDQWTLIAEKKKNVVIGARSAIFAPLENIGVIIVDEEHDQSYKQDSSPAYNARDMAVVRAKTESCPVILGSATPSVESYTNTKNNKFEILYLKKRANNAKLPEVSVYDLKKSAKDKGAYRFISYYLALEINQRLKEKEQVLLFLNKRGYSSFVLCNLCSEAVKCRFCSVTMTYHKSDDSLVCHFCGFRQKVPKECPDCANPNLVHLGTGTEKIEKACEFLFKDARIIRLDQDTTKKKGELVKKLKAIRKKEADIIIGTQMIAKGHDFPDITLVGIINADHGFNFPDFRAAEKTFQVLSQVSGRTGRGEKKGKVIMQTYNPDHFSIQTAKTQNFINFYNQEINFRKSLFYPPFAKIALVKISGTDEKLTDEFSKKCKNNLMDIRLKFNSTITVLGPAKSPVYMAAARFRFQILLKSKTSGELNLVLKKFKEGFSSFPSDIRMTFDIDPYSMM